MIPRQGFVPVCIWVCFVRRIVVPTVTVTLAIGSMQAQNGMNGVHQIEDHARTENAPHSSQPTPLFERLVTEEVQELKNCLRMIDSQQRRLHELEKVHGDLEARLELESRERSQLETTLEEREREWASKFQHLEADRDLLQHLKEQEESKTKRLMEQLNRKGQEIHRMLQRKVKNIRYF